MLESGVVGALWLEESVFGVLLSCGLAVELPEAPPDEVVELGWLVGVLDADVEGVPVPWEGSLSGTFALGAFGAGFVLFPPFGVCSLIGWLLCDCEVASGAWLLPVTVCAIAKLVDSSASVAMYVSFFMIPISLP